MKIGDRCFVRGHIDEIRKDTVIIRNARGYFGTIPSEVITGGLPSAQPETCEDAVSRKAVYDAMVEKGQRSRRYKLGEIWELNGTEIREALDTVPSVTPKQERGKWIDGKVKHIENGELRNVRECSECGSSYFVYDNYNSVEEIPNFCPNCGADMRGGQDE